jgi:hypothetical protein
MRHNKIIGWERFLGVVEQVHKVSPWLSRQIAQRASEWPFWYSGARIREWREQQVWVELAPSFRNSVEGEISQGHLWLAGELTLRLVLLHYRQEYPFTYRLTSGRIETYHPVEQTVDFKFEIGFNEWQRIRLDLARDSRSAGEFVLSAHLRDGRLAASLAFQAAFTAQRFLPSK